MNTIPHPQHWAGVKHHALFDSLAQHTLRAAGESLYASLEEQWRTCVGRHGAQYSLWTYVGTYLLRMDSGIIGQDVNATRSYVWDLSDAEFVEAMRNGVYAVDTPWEQMEYFPPADWGAPHPALLKEYQEELQELCRLAVKEWSRELSTRIIIVSPSDNVRALAGTQLGGRALTNAVESQLNLICDQPAPGVFTVAEWRAEVANDDTRLGYEAWVTHRTESLRDECVC